MGEYENKSINEYMTTGELAFGGGLYLFVNGTVTMYQFEGIEGEAFDEDKRAILTPIQVISYQEPDKWQTAFGKAKLKVDIYRDKRFATSLRSCLFGSCVAIRKEIERQQWLLQKSIQIAKANGFTGKK
jgi:hypothetical protein